MINFHPVIVKIRHGMSSVLRKERIPLRKLGIIILNIFSESYMKRQDIELLILLKNHQVSSWYMFTASGLEATHAIPIIPGNCSP